MIFFASTVTFLLAPTQDIKQRVGNWLAGMCAGLTALIFFVIYRPTIAYVYQGILLIVLSSFVSVIWPVLARKIKKKTENLDDDL